MKAKKLYPDLWVKKWNEPLAFLEAFATGNYLILGGCRDFAKEILSRDPSWKWLGERVDDFGSLVEEKMRKKVQKWIWRSYFGVGALSNRLCSTEMTAKWLMDRYVNELKNLFDKRYKDALDIQKVYVLGLEEFHAVAATTAWDIDSVEESGELYHIGGEV
ncbi:hypothetical protein RZR97_02780 [Hydrogenimonas thermophila]|uniref:hypothetical protein n=1 Tax=Hydrogenimonas thermophila TaxID=223786 RepID=UPI002936ECDD|nr:hypothetical protein [Hydrogenimonas thermophila]WOE70506.1 hypothetical protein RZR91_02800 [Hydrogenimonas thermophila]WOE73022.1 hypothetical protein RZR97_02780 [Hydrogenimonas thermophila]